ITYYTLRDNNSIFEVVSLPWHVGHQQVSTEGQLTTCGSITLTQRLSFYYLFAFHHERRQVDTGILIGSSELDQVVCLEFIVKAYQLLLFVDFVFDYDLLSVNKFNYSVSFCQNQR